MMFFHLYTEPASEPVSLTQQLGPTVFKAYWVHRKEALDLESCLMTNFGLTKCAGDYDKVEAN